KGWLERVKETLFFSIDEQANDVGLSEKGRTFLSPNDSDAFMIPDLATEFSAVDALGLSDAEALEKKQEMQSDFEKRAEIIHNVSQLLKAYTLFQNDVHYVVMENKVMIVDEHTGRIMDGRRFSDGLHQALEAKEGVKIERETQTLASITIQNYFRMYDKLAGMTGTAETEATEFKDIYELNVVTIPTNRPCIRKDEQDRIYKTKREKYNAIINEIKERNATGQPILLGTISVDVSEVLSNLLNKAKIPHKVLNAKNHQFEADIVERAGQLGSITIATNMAGRGTDIKLGEGVKEVGGLHVIASERHDSRRIDRQLRGRCSRQGDEGSSVFYVSLEDDLMRLFGSDRVSSIMDRLGMQEGEELQSAILSRAIGGAQKKVENQHYSVRRQILQYDDVMNKQREVIYGFRKEVIQADHMRELLFDVVERAIDDSFDKFVPENPTHGPINKEDYCAWLQGMFPVTIPENLLGEGKKFDREKALEDIVKLVDDAYALKESSEDPEALRWLESEIILNAIDKLYKEHLYEMDQLRNSIHLRSHAQKDPLVEYKREAFELFKQLMDQISTEILSNMFRSSTSIEAMREFLMNINMQEIHEESEQFDGVHTQEPAGLTSGPEEISLAPEEPLRPLTRSQPKVGRNDPCPCGSGRKFKQCCDKN
ncbi:MAG: SEC-C domain-containing protein, partial [Lentisphaeria bacterium]|nr:SEC-C domain-containing protein [Lentisphaeria bacterium]